jgi:hypothetical protein
MNFLRNPDLGSGPLIFRILVVIFSKLGYSENLPRNRKQKEQVIFPFASTFYRGRRIRDPDEKFLGFGSGIKHP